MTTTLNPTTQIQSALEGRSARAQRIAGLVIGAFAVLQVPLALALQGQGQNGLAKLLFVEAIIRVIVATLLFRGRGVAGAKVICVLSIVAGALKFPLGLLLVLPHALAYNKLNES
jgi:hypothetical protein